MDKTTKKIIKVAFLGDATAKPKDLNYRLAVKTAKLLAENGYIIVNGGGPGIMAAATSGAKSGGGLVEVVVLDPEKEPRNYEGIDKKNLGQSDNVVVTDSYEHRLNKLIEVADAFVIFNGGTGTLSEVGMIWENAKFDYGHHEPLIFMGKEWKTVVKTIEDKMKFEEKEKRVVTVVEKPEEVLKALKQVES